MAIKLITFDLDDTLWDIRPVLIGAEKATEAWLKEHYPALSEHFDRQKLVDLRLKLLSTQPQLAHQISQLRIEAMREALRAANYDATQAERGAHDAFDVFIHHRHEVKYFEQVTEAMAKLSPNYTLGVLTNGNADIFKLELGGYFDFAYSAEQLNSSKPAPDHFLAALEFSDVAAAEMIHVGDHHEHDIAAAQQLGIATIWVNIKQEEWPGSKRPDREIRHFSELPAAISEIDS